MQQAQSHQTEIDLSFPHSYEILDSYELPGSGMSAIPTFSLPLPRNRQEHSGIWLTVRASSGRAWTGVFAQGDLGGISRIMSSPDPDSFLVISGGAAYLVCAEDPNSWKQLPVQPVTNALANEKHQIVILTDFNRLAAYGPGGLRWKSSVLCADSLQLLGVDGDTVKGTGYDPGSNEGTVNFAIDLNTGAKHTL